MADFCATCRACGPDRLCRPVSGALSAFRRPAAHSPAMSRLEASGLASHHEAVRESRGAEAVSAEYAAREFVGREEIFNRVEPRRQQETRRGPPSSGEERIRAEMTVFLSGLSSFYERRRPSLPMPQDQAWVGPMQCLRNRFVGQDVILSRFAWLENRKPRR